MQNQTFAVFYKTLFKNNRNRYFKSSVIYKKRLSKVERSQFQLDKNLKEVLTGNLLGDG